MTNRPTAATTARFWFCLTAVLFLIAAAGVAFRSVRAADGETVSAWYARGVLRVTIPYELPRAGAGRLTVEVLDPDDNVLGHAERDVDVGAGKGRWREEIPFDKPPALEDLVWQRLRYSFAYGASPDTALMDTQSLSEVLKMPIVRILGQQSYISGAQASVRVIVTDTKNIPVEGPGDLRIELLRSGEGPRLLFQGRLDRSGSAAAQFRLPPEVSGAASLHYAVDTPAGSAEFTQSIRIEDKAAILLTTEKPIYQPGQTIHIRALALDRGNHEAASARNLTFEVEDARGNKVFRNATQTDKFGIASTEFTLADEVNLGTYHIRAVLAAPSGNTNAGELAVNVERYVLPKFKVDVEFGGAEKARRGYRPGDRVTGTVRANYFFGKAVDRADVSVKASALDVAMFQAGAAQGKTDADGVYHFDFKLPDYFAGHPLTQGAARVLVEATVKDGAGHSETRGEPITVSQSPLLLTAVPEGGELIPGIDNQVFLLASYPDGSPARANLAVRIEGDQDRKTTTDENGVATVLLPAGHSSETLHIDAGDAEGNRASSDVPLTSRGGADQILLRTDRAIYRAGDRIGLSVFSTRQRGTAYIDVVREGQTVLTRDVDLVNGRADLSLTASAELAGAVDFNAYLFSGSAQPVADHRLAFVQPAEELNIETTSDAAEYKPGGEARIRFRVTNSKGQGVQAALGLQVVDEAVFALAEKQPGFAKVFFYLEQEVMKPRYEIHSLGMPALITSAAAEPRQQAARALFAATELVDANRFEITLGDQPPRAKYAEYAARYTKRFQEQSRELAAVLSQEYSNAGAKANFDAIAARLAAAGSPLMRDFWGTPLRVEAAAGAAWRPEGSCNIRSAGPDKRFGTSDDLEARWIQMGTLAAAPPAFPASNFEPVIEHGRGPANGLAEISGAIADSSRAAVPGAQVEARDLRTAATRDTVSGPQGIFVFHSLRPGDYAITVRAPGFRTAVSRFTLEAGDRASCSIVLALGALTEEISVTASATPVQTASAENGGLLDANALRNLSLKGRDLFATLQVVPGVAMGNAFLAGAVGGMGRPAPPPAAEPAPHVRSYFPEALYINPEIITDGAGLASITIPIADSITTWRMAMLASTPRGALGSGASSIKVFQDFF
ncbi:MAG TPA: MG2 domain-containing protein, partial [Bryobacteraceae bacterium]|nr:MG2 domain-containing protein [Bryobacteraceae bacterium]